MRPDVFAQSVVYGTFNSPYILEKMRTYFGQIYIYIYSFFVVHRVRKHSSKIDKENCIVCADNEKLAKRYVGIAPTWQISVCDEFSLVNHCFFKIVHLCLGLA